MLLLIHILVASSGVVLSSWALISPTRRKFRLTYAAVALTIISGALLIVSRSAHILSTCISGLTYIAVVSVLLAAARWRLARQLND